MPYKDPENAKKRRRELYWADPEKHRAETKKHRLRNLERVREAQRRRYHESQDAEAAKRNTEEYRAGRAAYARQYRQLHKEKMAAYWTVKKAIKRGEIAVPDSCSKCGASTELQAHHHCGYARENRLNVVWLCKACHRQEHSGPRPFKPRKSAVVVKSG